MFLDLDSEESLDPTRAGAKAAWLAMARAAGLPVLPGFVVEARASKRHMKLGADLLPSRGSGAARLAMSREPVSFADDLAARGAALGDRLVARSSAPFEASGVWAGAFTSYLDLSPRELHRGIVGCWASAFAVDPLERQLAMGRDPGDLLMAVLVQPALTPAYGGSARIDNRGVITVHGVDGSPAPLLQGWVSGATARWEGFWEGDELIDLIGSESLAVVASILRDAASKVGANVIEWAIDGDVWLLQLGEAVDPDQPALSVVEVEAAEELLGLVLTVTLAPGPLGEELVQPWALGGIPTGDGDHSEDPLEALSRARVLSDSLISLVWSAPPAEARARATDALRRVRAGDKTEPRDGAVWLPADAEPSALSLMANLEVVRNAMVEAGVSRNPDAAWFLRSDQIEKVLQGAAVLAPSRVGFGKWEPLIGATVLALGQTESGIAAVPGIGAGKASYVDGSHNTTGFAPRNVLSSHLPEPPLAPLLWDAAGVVTEAGSPAAHLFDSARSLGVPAISGVRLNRGSDLLVSVDGHRGTVTTLPYTRRSA